MRADRDDSPARMPKVKPSKGDFSPTEELKETSPEREWKIKRLQETYGLSREAAERLVDESFGTE